MPEFNNYIDIEGFVLTAPDLRGRFRRIDGEPGETRSAETAARFAPVEQALRREDIVEVGAFELHVDDDGGTVQDEATRSVRGGVTRQGEDAIQFEIPALPEGEYVLLYSDESGATRWFFPEEVTAEPTDERGGTGKLLFRIPRRTVEVPVKAEAEDHRGPLTRLGRRVIQVLAWPVAPLIGLGVQALARQWEDRKRPYGWRKYPFNGEPGDPDWKAMQSGRALMFVHGTFSTSQGGFSGLVTPEAERLEAFYGGRIFGFDHPTISRDPLENAEEFVRMLPPGNFEVDVVTHSRGGLVARTLMERLHPKSVRVRRAVIVASPNLGTPLADGKHVFDFIDRMTNLTLNLPDDALTITLEAILSFVKLVYRGGTGGLPGIVAMLPEGEFVTELGRLKGSGVDYYVAGAHFDPKLSENLASIFTWGGSEIIEKLMGQGSDCVVPMDGALQLAPGEYLPPERTLRVEGGEVFHTSFFNNAVVAKQIADWLCTEA